jgi:hypothetical protein
MPLMGDWSDALAEALEDEEERLSEACVLEEGMSPEEFEKSLGLLIRWDQVRHLDERFKWLGGDRAMSLTNEPDVTRARENMNRRMEVVMATVNATLYEQFGLGRVDDERAVAAYQALLRHFGKSELAIATTNYDRSAERALDALGRHVTTGFPPSAQRTPRLRPAGMASDRNSGTPVIHLHGAVGWYERDGNIEDHYGDQPYNPSLGTPAVLYPDPDKDPTSSAYVSLLWTEFRAAMDQADVVLVIGHSLHDRALVDELKRVRGKKPLGVTYFADEEDERISALIGDAIPIQMDFGPEIEVDGKALSRLTA